MGANLGGVLTTIIWYTLAHWGTWKLECLSVVSFVWITLLKPQHLVLSKRSVDQFEFTTLEIQFIIKVWVGLDGWTGIPVSTDPILRHDESDSKVQQISKDFRRFLLICQWLLSQAFMWAMWDFGCVGAINLWLCQYLKSLHGGVKT